MPNSEEIKKQIEKLNEKLRIAEILEGKGNVAQEVKHRILELVPDFPNIEYVLWSIHATGKAPKGTRYSVPKTRTEWTSQMDDLLVKGKHDDLVKDHGVTMAAVRSHATKLGFKFRLNKPLSAA